MKRPRLRAFVKVRIVAGTTVVSIPQALLRVTGFSVDTRVLMAASKDHITIVREP